MRKLDIQRILSTIISVGIIDEFLFHLCFLRFPNFQLQPILFILKNHILGYLQAFWVRRT